MAKKPTEARRKLIEFDAQTWHALLQKYGRPTDLKAALRESARSSSKPDAAARRRESKERR